jgi:hypothetical protein
MFSFNLFWVKRSELAKSLFVNLLLGWFLLIILFSLFNLKTLYRSLTFCRKRANQTFIVWSLVQSAWSSKSRELFHFLRENKRLVVRATAGCTLLLWLGHRCHLHGWVPALNLLRIFSPRVLRHEESFAFHGVGDCVAAHRLLLHPASTHSSAVFQWIWLLRIPAALHWSGTTSCLLNQVFLECS